MPEPQSAELNPEIRRMVDAACSAWTRRLIDHSRANSLLFFRDLKVGTLDLTKDADAVSRLIAGNALHVEDLIPKPKPKGNPNLLPEAPPEHPPGHTPEHATDEKARSEARKRVKSGLIALQRKALSNLEEKGIETLHLAMGMATWPASDGGKPYNAPLVLLPARIEMRGRAGNELRLTVLGEPQLNPVLLYVLEENFSIQLNPATLLGDGGGDENGQAEPAFDPAAVYERMKLEAKGVPQFEVIPRVVLGNFQFAKLAMVEDLKRNANTIAQSPIVAAIAGHQASRQSMSQLQSDIDPSKLDERASASDFLVLDADSSQARVVALVARGQNGVVQGPPGTGKSQTIANIIAQGVSEGRRILFVAEKRAALDAVIKRLKHRDVGLGHLVLDLHGASVSRKEVMARISHALEQIHNSAPTDGADAVHRDFDARRKTLNEHAARVNELKAPTGLSINRIIGKILRLPPAAKSEVRFRGELFSGLSPERVAETKQWIQKGAANFSIFLGTDASPWNNADLKDGQKAQEAIDLATLAATEFWPRFAQELKEAIRQIGILTPATLGDARQFIEILSHARQISDHYDSKLFSEPLSELAASLSPAGRGLFAKTWACLTNAGYRSARKRLVALRSSKAPATDLLQEVILAQELLRRWCELCAGSEIPVCADNDAKLSEAFAKLGNSIEALVALTGAPSPFTIPIQSACLWLCNLAKDKRTPYQLPEIYALRATFSAAGLDPFLNDLREASVAPEHWANRFEFIWLSSALDLALSSDPALATFNGRAHEKIVEEFCRLDRERIQLAATRLRRLHAERAVAAMNQNFDQANLIRTEAAKKSRHIPIRKLLSRAPDVLTRISPCWVASPLSVSQLLDGGKRHFDIVVFDEASQILQEEAIPALYRAEQVVVAGDRHQLPPTTFFATAVEGEDDLPEEGEEQQALATATAAIGGFDSLLGTLQAFLPNWFLEWHYRSEDERLITFSNTHIYGGRLITFPSAREQDAIRHILVPHDPSLGTQEESASREVLEVVKQVLTHAKRRPDESLGVITMGIKHANRVQAGIDHALERYPELSDFFSLDREERFFVKNLETVQGDERDAIILSVGYGKNANGDLPHRFGPLAQDVGYRRLNVAVTRAKRRMCTISSFSWNEIDLERSGSRGVVLLKAYLEYAASGGSRLPQPETPGGDLNAFEADVRDALEERGIRTRPQYGASHYWIDLVAMHPQKQGRPVLAIECDGASYHSSATARDRDRLRQEHLQRLGWRFHRVWSTDWFYSREQETERAVSAFKDAVCRADKLDSNSGSQLVSERPRKETEGPPPAPVPPEPSRRPAPAVLEREAIDDYSESELMDIAKWVASDGKLRTDEEMIHEIFAKLPFKKMGSRIRKRLEKIAKRVRPKQSA